MHLQIVTFRLHGIDEVEYRTLCDDLAPAFAACPGLLAKVWLADSASNIYGGVYAWRDRSAMEAFARGDLFGAVLAHKHLIGVASKDFEVLEGPTAVTNGRVGLSR